MMINKLADLSTANRLLRLEDRASGSALINGDFTGSVTGLWVRLGENGEGVVAYRGKEYKTKSIGFVSVPKGTAVELSYADGIYYSKF